MDAVIEKAHREDKKKHIADVGLRQRLEVINTSLVSLVDQRVIEKYPAQRRDSTQDGGHKKKPAPVHGAHKDHPADRGKKAAAEICPDEAPTDVLLKKISNHHQAQRCGARRRDPRRDLRRENRRQRLAHPGDQTEDREDRHGSDQNGAVGKNRVKGAYKSAPKP